MSMPIDHGSSNLLLFKPAERTAMKDVRDFSKLLPRIVKIPPPPGDPNLHREMILLDVRLMMLSMLESSVLPVKSSVPK